MVPSRTLRYIAPVVLVSLLALPTLAQQDDWRPPPSYSEQKQRVEQRIEDCEGPARLPGGVWQPPRPAWCEKPGRQSPPAGAQSADILVATWILEYMPGGYATDDRMIYRAGKMVLEMRHPGGELLVAELIERPSSAGARTFALDESDMADYFTLSANGVVTYFESTGVLFATSRAIFVSPDVMTIGSNVQATACVPKELSGTALKVLRLHKELHGFKDTPEFARFGFGLPIVDKWLERLDVLRSLPNDRQWRVHDELGFFIGDLWQLAFNYMIIADTYSANTREARETNRDMEVTIKTGIARATCQREGKHNP